MKNKIFDWVHHNFLVAILLCYGFGAFFPAVGISISKIHFGIIGGEGETLKLSIPFLMISLLLFNSALGVNQGELKNLKKQSGSFSLGIDTEFLHSVTGYFDSISHDDMVAQS